MAWSGRAREGTRFRLFPQAPYRGASRTPETVWLSPPAGTIGPGPADDRMYVIDPIGKRRPYGLNLTSYDTPYLYLPPWEGPRKALAEPDEGGHFDHLDVETPEFEAANAYGVARFVLDVWQHYFNAPIQWHFAREYRRLEISLLRRLGNATAGYGFMELGSHFTETGEPRPLSLNFDVIAHELGHLIIYSTVGLPNEDAVAGEYFGFHESAADLTALVAVLHFESVVEDLLETTRGNLYTFNELNRFAELSENDEIRIASNPRKLSEFAAGWTKEHDLSEPLTGAIFDVFVDVFHESLVDRGLISPEVEDLLDDLERSSRYAGLIQRLFDQAFAKRREEFRAALLDARDYLGAALVGVWQRLPADDLNYEDVGDTLLEVDRELSGGRHQRAIVNNFVWREIGAVRVGPRLATPDGTSHVLSARTVTPDNQFLPRPLSYRERWQLGQDVCDAVPSGRPSRP